MKTSAAFVCALGKQSSTTQPDAEAECAQVQDGQLRAMITVAFKLQVFAFIAQPPEGGLPNPEALRHPTYRD